MIRIYILTTTRAEYGLLRPLIKRMDKDPEIDMRLLITGTHLSYEYGHTIEEIADDGFDTSHTIDILSGKKGREGVAETLANAIVKFTDYFRSNRPDFLYVDGDRYETMAVCVAAVNSNIPIIHSGGGATTEGASDECWRHMITKMSFIHFPTAELYRERIIRMGESPDRVFTVGSIGLENIRNEKLLTKEELERQLNFKLDKPYGVVTFQPVTLENDTMEEQMRELFAATESTRDMKFIFTKANADAGGDRINELLDIYAEQHKDSCICRASLGAIRYLSSLKYCSFVMGNSSSGIIEAPSFGVPTINIGDRQKGRLQADSILNCRPEKADILRAIMLARRPDVIEKCKNTKNPFGDGVVSEKIVAYVKQVYNRGGSFLKKEFYDPA